MMAECVSSHGASNLQRVWGPHGRLSMPRDIKEHLLSWI